jgi:hypothetical protein
VGKVAEYRKHNYNIPAQREVEWLDAITTLIDMGMPIAHECPPGQEGECVVCRAGQKIMRAYNLIESAANDVETII